MDTLVYVLCIAVSLYSLRTAIKARRAMRVLDNMHRRMFKPAYDLLPEHERPRFVFLCPDDVILEEHRRAAPGSAMMFASRMAMRARGLTLPPPGPPERMVL